MKSFFHINLTEIEPFNEALLEITAPHIFNPVVAGLVLMTIMVAISFYLTLGRAFGLLKLKSIRAVIPLIVGCAGCIPFFVAIAVLFTLKSKTSKAGDLPSWITVQYGKVDSLCILSSVCGFVAAVLGSVASLGGKHPDPTMQERVEVWGQEETEQETKAS